MTFRFLSHPSILLYLPSFFLLADLGCWQKKKKTLPECRTQHQQNSITTINHQKKSTIRSLAEALSLVVLHISNPRLHHPALTIMVNHPETSWLSPNTKST